MNTSVAPNVAIVTGAGRGIGAAISEQLARDGWRVLGFDLTWPATNAPALQSRTQVDVADYDAVAQAVDGAEATHGPIGLVVNNAGITRDAAAHKMDPRSQWSAVLNVNLTGAFHLCRAALPHMRARKFGRIVNISSMNALRGQFGQANYAAAKAGMIAMTKSIAQENASLGITANCIAPGFIDTDMTRAMRPDILVAEAAKIPVGRKGTPDDIAAAVVFLSSAAASFITGQVLSVNGGQLMP
ncbi:MAG: SDR family oxidoreductase [Alphaproteobacteria bacterium]|nr:SDR family oxidoreductase [Alphaproteobacteria bacterium]